MGHATEPQHCCATRVFLSHNTFFTVSQIDDEDEDDMITLHMQKIDV